MESKFDILNSRLAKSSKSCCDSIGYHSTDKLNEKGGKISKFRASRKLSTLSVSTDKDNSSTKSVPIENYYDIREHYETIGTLGMGTYAYVRLAVNIETRKQVAIKASKGTNWREMLKNEYEILKIINFPSVIKPIEFLNDDTRNESYLILEYFEGKNLEEFVTQNGTFSEEQTNLVVKQILEAIDYLHSKSIAHRDIKPENILINDNYEVKLIDFNVSKVYQDLKLSWRSDEVNKFKSVFYTQISSPLYTAPEIKNQISYSESIDIWGAGIIMFTCLFGTLQEFSLEKVKSAKERCWKLNDLVSNSDKITDNTKNTLLSMLSKNAEERPLPQEILKSLQC